MTQSLPISCIQTSVFFFSYCEKSYAIHPHGYFQTWVGRGGGGGERGGGGDLRTKKPEQHGQMPEC